LVCPFLLALVLASENTSSAAIATPSAFLKMPVGADRTLADYRQIASYFRHLDAESDRMEIEVLGKTTLGEDMIMAVISSEANLDKKDRLKAIARRLAEPRGLSDDEATALVRDGRTIVLVTCNIHATEIGSSQMAMEWAHGLVTGSDAETKRRLDNVVVLLVPSLNPDGQIMVTDWYRKHVGTKYEAGRMPWLYHHYVGHDNNRDWLHLTQKETRAMSRAIYHEWFPQVFVDEHQQGTTGPRMFIPPNSDPIDPDVPPLLWREIDLIGTHMTYRLEQAGKAGVIYDYVYDGYWVGGTRNTSWWKNITGLLTEVASARLASPVYIEPTEFARGSKGLIEYKPQVNYPNPWKGGWWRLRDIIDYERIASDALVEVAADRREDLLRGILHRARTAIASAAPGEAYRIPAAQYDYPSARRLARLLADHGVDVFADRGADYWVPLAQPYARFIREILEPQRYPEIRPGAGGDILRPYDIVSWSLPLAMGVTVERTTLPGGGVKGMTPVAAPILGAVKIAAAPGPRGGSVYAVWPGSPEAARVVNAALRAGGTVSRLKTAFEGGRSERAWPAGTFLLDGKGAAAAASLASDAGVSFTPMRAAPPGSAALRTPRVGLYKSWTASMDEGWTRFLLEQYGFDPKSLDTPAVRRGKLGDGIDAIILPSMSKDSIARGNTRKDSDGYGQEVPPEYRDGLDKDGAKALREFVEAGGTLIAFGDAVEYVTGEFNIPVENSAGKSGITVPGSILRARLGREHPVTWGMRREFDLFQDSAITLATQPPGPGVDRWVLATYPEDERDILRSGWIEGADKLAGKTAAVAVTYGKGKIALFGFRPQNRGQTHATFPLVFNAIYWAVQ
jgi:hypothetical protein